MVVNGSSGIYIGRMLPIAVAVLGLDHEAAASARLIDGGMACVLCGCTEYNACPGGCAWAAPNLCSRCAARL